VLQDLLKDSRVRIAAWVVGAIFIGYWANAAWLNRVHFLEHKIHSSFVLYKDILIQRAAILPQMNEMFKNYAPQEQALSQELTQNYELAMRYQPPEQMLSLPKLMAEYQQLQTSIINSMEKAQKIAPNYPALSQNRQYFMITNQWSYLNGLLLAQEGDLNRYIGLYNGFLNDFPLNLYNKISYRIPQKIASQMPIAKG
jgi:hypothetical protein